MSRRVTGIISILQNVAHVQISKLAGIDHLHLFLLFLALCVSLSLAKVGSLIQVWTYLIFYELQNVASRRLRSEYSELVHKPKCTTLQNLSL